MILLMIFSINHIILIIDSKRIVSRSSYYHLNYIIEKSLHLFLFYSFLILYNHPNLTIKYNSSYFNTYQILYSKFYFLYENIFILSYNLSFLCVHLMYVQNVQNFTFTYITVINIHIFMQRFICYICKTNTCKNIYQGIYFS